MWTPDQDRLVRILLHADGQDVETLWAEDLGPVAEPPGSRRVRIGNVPFLHPKPTYGDVILVEPAEDDGMLTWDSAGVSYEDIGTRIAEDGGRWAMIVEYELMPNARDAKKAFHQLDLVGANADIAVEACFEPRDGRPGRAYLAVPDTMSVDAVLAMLQAAKLPLSLTLVHPRDDDDDDDDA